MVDPKVGKPFQLRWASVVKELLAQPENRKYRIRKDELLKLTAAELPEVNQFLQLTINDIRAHAKHVDCNAKCLCEFVCHQARPIAEDKSWHQTMCYLWQIEKWLRENFGRLRGAEKSGFLVHEMAGFPYGANRQLVQDAIRDRDRGKLEPTAVRNLLLPIVLTAPATATPDQVDKNSVAQSKPEEEQDEGGRPEGPMQRTVLRNRMAAISELQERRQKEIAADLFPEVEDATEQMRKAYDYFSHHRTEINVVKNSLSTRRPEELSELYILDASALKLLLAANSHRRRRTRKKPS